MLNNLLLIWVFLSNLFDQSITNVAFKSTILPNLFYLSCVIFEIWLRHFIRGPIHGIDQFCKWNCFSIWYNILHMYNKKENSLVPECRETWTLPIMIWHRQKIYWKIFEKSQPVWWSWADLLSTRKKKNWRWNPI